MNAGAIRSRPGGRTGLTTSARQACVLLIDSVGDSSPYRRDRGRLNPVAVESRKGPFVRVVERRLRLIEKRLNARAANEVHALVTELLAAEDPDGSNARVPRIMREDREEWELCAELWVRAARREGRRMKRMEDCG